ncbi:MAG: 1-deoxy-D-xylulose-5-phosphate reductoisomerase [Chloroflexi bacterium RBG_13_57_8]|nr:MAG: 1-deoxy-D-xylulose-5-phosphate reductoisomerase [Chloroflexi bacterium RBG_13_57_8]
MAEKVKQLAVLGSTGSIGRQTLDVVRELPRHFKIVGLTAGINLDLLEEQVDEFRPRFVSYTATSRELTGCEIITLEEMVSHPEIDVVVIATAGTAGLGATLAAARAGKTIALANKESLVAAGEIITAEAKKNGARIIPIDSEHSAIFQCLNGENQAPRRIILTASGGPFRSFTSKQMENITVEQALAHPSWKMGQKVTIDSATLMNKGLEVIEAYWLFNTPIDNVTVLVHPQSIVHSMVEFVDGAVKAQLSCPDMRLPIQYALTYPERLENRALPALDWANFKDLTFEPPDAERFPCLALAIAAGKAGGTKPAVLCGADETAVGLFLEGRVKFTDIPRLISGVLAQHKNKPHPSLDDILKADRWAREKALEMAGGGEG